MKKAAIIGATGFGGLGLIEILKKHPHIEVTQLVARQDIGKKINEIFPHLTDLCELPVKSLEDLDYETIDIVFFSTPDRVGMRIIKPFYDKGIPVIDFSGDFRFTSAADYASYAANKGMETEHFAEELLSKNTFGLPEKFADDIKKSKIVGNPGCMAITMILGLLPAVENNLLSSEVIFCDGKTGVSGAGRYSGDTNLYPQRYENVNSYREGHHQHIVEVEKIINVKNNSNKRVLFIPHIVPMTRGISVTCFADLGTGISQEELFKLYTNYYKDKPFIYVTEKSTNSAYVKGTNRCVIKPAIDKRTGRFFVNIVLDNLMKGQSGNAIQVANLLLDFPETTGLDFPGYYP